MLAEISTAVTRPPRRATGIVYSPVPQPNSRSRPDSGKCSRRKLRIPSTSMRLKLTPSGTRNFDSYRDA